MWIPVLVLTINQVCDLGKLWFLVYTTRTSPILPASEGCHKTATSVCSHGACMSEGGFVEHKVAKNLNELGNVKKDGGTYQRGNKWW